MAGSLPGKRILIVEDEYMIASDLNRALEQEDAIVVGPTGSVAQALSLLATGTVDAAVLDVNLEGASSYPIADRLADARVPFVFMTGQDGAAMPEPYRSAPRVAKPFPIELLLACVGRLVDRGVAR